MIDMHPELRSVADEEQGRTVVINRQCDNCLNYFEQVMDREALKDLAGMVPTTNCPHCGAHV